MNTFEKLNKFSIELDSLKKRFDEFVKEVEGNQEVTEYVRTCMRNTSDYIETALDEIKDAIWGKL